MVFGLNSVYTTHQRLMALSPAEAKEPLSETLKKAGKKALGGGVAGAVAMFVNVGTLMWMRTTVNYQYRYGMGTFEAIGHLYKEGGGGLSGIRRFYRGVGPALFQGPLSRFGDTASNAGMLALWDSLEFTKELPMWTKSVSASLAAASFRVFLMPIDAMKTILQVEGADGLQKLQAKIRKGGPGVLYAGSAGAMSATFVGHYPWFYTNNYLNSVIPKYDRTENLPMFLARNAFVGFCSSAVSDTCAPLRRAHPTPERADAPRRPRRTPLARHPSPPLSHRRAPHAPQVLQLDPRGQDDDADVDRADRLPAGAQDGDREGRRRRPLLPRADDEDHLERLPGHPLQRALADGAGRARAAREARREVGLSSCEGEAGCSV